MLARLRRGLRRLLRGRQAEPAAPAPVIPEPAIPEPVKPSPPESGVRLNLGCGFDHRPGWVNIDLHAWHNPDIVGDVTWLQMIEDGSADYILAQDILEHIHRVRCMTALTEWNRVLKIGGAVDIRAPDVIGIVDLMRTPERDNIAGHKILLQCMFGTQNYLGDYHLNGFTETYLRECLDLAGFEVEYLGRHHQWLFDVVARKVRHQPPEPFLRAKDDASFVKAAHVEYKGREADNEALAYYERLLQGGAPREAVVEFLQQPE